MHAEDGVVDHGCERQRVEHLLFGKDKEVQEKKVRFRRIKGFIIRRASPFSRAVQPGPVH